MDKPKNNQARPNETVTSAELKSRAAKLIQEGRIPNVEEFVRAMIPVRKRWVQHLKANGAIPLDHKPVGLLGVFQEILNVRATADPSKPVAISEHDAARDEFRDVMGPGGFRAGLTKALGRKPVVSIRRASPTPQRSLPGEAESDLIVRNEGTVCTFTANTESGARFLREDVLSEGWQWLGRTLCLDYRIAQVVIDGAQAEGLTVGCFDIDGQQRIKNPPKPDGIA